MHKKIKANVLLLCMVCTTAGATEQEPWANCEDLSTVSANILIAEGLDAMGDTTLREWLKTTEHQTLLGQWQICCAAMQAGENNLLQHTEALQILQQQPQLMQLFAFGGACKNPAKALSYFSSILQAYPAAATNVFLQEIALATALEFAMANTTPQQAIERAVYYMSTWQEGALNTVFDTLPFWQRRMVCGANPLSPYGSVAGLQWSLSHVHLPADQYKTCLWRCPYSPHNLYGDYVHGKHYYAPFEKVYGDNYAAMTYEVGGVCISLSHFAAFAALANGIPAMAVSEPGHCSFLILEDTKWVPAYSMHWQRRLHWQVFSGMESYSTLHAATELFSAEQAESKMVSDALRVLAAVYASKGNTDKAAACYQRAVTILPCNIYAWQEWLNYLAHNRKAGATQWQILYDTLCVQLTPRYPELAAKLLGMGIIQGMARSMRHNTTNLRSKLLRFWEHVKPMGPERWHIERLLETQMEALSINESNGSAVARFYTEVHNILRNNTPYAAIVEAWAISLSLRLPPRQLQCFQQVLKEASCGSAKN